MQRRFSLDGDQDFPRSRLMRRRSTAQKILVGVSVSLLCLACTLRRTVPASPTVLPWIRWATSELPVNERVLALISEGLTRLEPRGNGYQLVGGLAESWTQSANVWIFRLKKGIRWSSGTPLHAQELVDFWKMRGRGSLEGLQISAPSFEEIQVISASSDPSVPFSFAEPIAWPLHPTQGLRATLGPFLVEPEKPHSETLRFIRNPHYHGSLPKIAGIEIRAVPSFSVRLQLFLDHEVDCLDELPTDNLALVARHPGLKLFPTEDLLALTFRQTRKPFQTPALRKALVDAIDRGELLRMQPLPLLRTDRLQFDPERLSIDLVFNLGPLAKVFAEQNIDLSHSKYFEDSNWKPFQRPSLTFSPDPLTAAVATNLQAQWIKSASLFVDLLTTNKNTALPNSIEIARLSQPFLQTKNVLGRLRSDYPDFKKKLQTLENAEEILAQQEAVLVPLYRIGKYLLADSKIKNIVWSPANYWEFRNAAVE